ncbi:MAG: CBS domain-containing protein [Coriobacteriia bacterium]
MFYLTRMLGRPVLDADGEEIGRIHDIAIATREVFPRVTSLAFVGPDKTPFMLSWRKYIDVFDGERVVLNVPGRDLRFSYLQPDEVLLHRDLLNKQIVDTRGMKVVRVNDLKLSESRNQLRLLGAEVGARGILRGLSPALERAAQAVTRLVGRELAENIIAWNYMDLLDRDLSHVQLSVTHKRLHELHPADVADVLEQLTPAQRARVFEHLDNDQAAEAISELEDDLQAEVMEDLTSQRASDILEIMDPDDAADIIGDLPYDKAEALLRLMGVKEAREIRKLLGYKEKTAGGIMTPEVTTVSEEATVQQVIDHLREGAAENESIYYVYVVGRDRRLVGVVSLRDLIVSQPETAVADIVEREVFTVGPDEDQEDVAETMSKYDLLAVPVVDESGRILGIVTVDDALDVLEEESAEDLALATGRSVRSGIAGVWPWVSRNGWLAVWAVLFAAAGAVGRVYPPAGEPLFAGLLLSVVVMRVAEDVAAHAMSRVIETEEKDERQPLWLRMANDGLAGSLLGLLVGVLAFAVIEVWYQTPQLAEWLFEGSLLPYQAWLGLALGVSVLAVTLAGAVVGRLAENRADAGKRVSQTLMTATLMVFGAVVFLGMLWAVVGGSPVFRAR